MGKEEGKLKLKKLIKKLEKIRGRHTELVTVYIPQGYNLSDVVNQLKQEHGTADNIKSKSTRKNVTGALDKAVQHLKFYKKTPPNGLAIFSGNISENEGVTNMEIWAIEPPDPIKVKLYWCDQVFRLEPLKEQLKEKEVYGILVMDNSEAALGVLRGKSIQVIRKMDSIVPGKTGKGGQCLGCDTLVQTSSGNIIKIADLGIGPKVKSASFKNWSISDSRVLDAWSTKKECYKITTKYPRLEVESSKDHVFFVWENDKLIEKSVEELGVGDTLLMPEKIDIEGRRHKLNTDYHFSFGISKDGRDLIKSSRIERNMRQRDIAKKIGLTQTAISSVEIDKRDFKLENLRAICRELDIKFSNFFEKYVTPKNDAVLPNFLDADLSQILGYFIGDGNFDKNRIAFSEQDFKLATTYAKKMADLFGIPPKIRHRKNKGYYQTRLHSKSLERFFRHELVKSKDSLNASIPERVLTSSSEVLSAFLKGIFDAEGYVSRNRIGFGVNSKILATQVQMALLRFGILSSFLEYDNRRNPYSNNHRFTVEISEKHSLKTFGEDIGFESNKKMKKLQLALKSKSDKSNVRQILFSGKKIRNIIESHGMIKQNFPKVSNFFYDNRNMSKKAFQKSILDIAKLNKELHRELMCIFNCNVLPVKISKIEKTKKLVPMSDISVGQRNFIANGIFVHNSAQRYERVRSGLINDFYKNIAAAAKDVFDKDILGIIVGGPGPAKNSFLDGEYMETDVRKRVMGVVDTGYADEHGLHEAIERGKDMLSDAAFFKEKDLMKKFLAELQKSTGMVSYGVKPVITALTLGAVETILLSEKLDWVEVELECSCGNNYKDFVKNGTQNSQECSKCGKKLGVLGEMDPIDAFEILASKYGSSVEIISVDTREGEQLYQMGGIGAFLRYRL